MLIVDTSVLIDYLGDRRNWQTEWLDHEADRQPIGITSLVFSEVLQGIRDDSMFKETLSILNHFVIFEAGSPGLAITSAQSYRYLRRKGITIRSIVDTVTATFCIQEDHVLLHNDRDFDAFALHLGLRVVHPPSSAPS